MFSPKSRHVTVMFELSLQKEKKKFQPEATYSNSSAHMKVKLGNK